MTITMIIILIVTFGLPMLVQLYLRNTYNTWSQKRNGADLTGAEVARAILEKNGIQDVRVERTEGHLTDHYDPRSKVVRLSAANYDQPSVAGMAVAAHEVGHALQHAQTYTPLKMRTAILPAANFGGGIGQMLITGGFLMMMVGMGGLGRQLAIVGLIGVIAVALFQLVTLPVEFNASHRAGAELRAMGLVTDNDRKGIGNVLNAAALTYVAALAVTLMHLARYALILLGSRD